MVTLCIVAFAVVMVLSGCHGETVTFRVTDQDTGKPVPNVLVAVVDRWIRLPIERLHLPGITSQRTYLITSETGIVSIRLVAGDSAVFVVPGYHSATFGRGRPFDQISYSMGRISRVMPTNEVLLKLKSKTAEERD